MKKIVHTEKAPQALGPYNQAIIETRSGLVFTSGQIGIDPKTGELAGSDPVAQAHQVLNNLKEVLAAAGCSFENVIKSTIYLKNISDFAAVNSVYVEYFIRDFPVRSTVEVAGLPKDALLEIEMIAAL
ncbi:MAG TPA: reactive intermediate/imine deaminase [candidate division Zixibacteria bacterium]|nr:reactive intermediate/imine deaminase [candidate division Zixibacteria bacterium]HBZ01510.1 reactive intermediate/imine deaminase [candidate division Zixibacteria bacterium]